MNIQPSKFYRRRRHLQLQLIDCDLRANPKRRHAVYYINGPIWSYLWGRTIWKFPNGPNVFIQLGFLGVQLSFFFLFIYNMIGYCMIIIEFGWSKLVTLFILFFILVGSMAKKNTPHIVEYTYLYLFLN